MINQALINKRRVAELLRNIRLDAGLTQSQIADRIKSTQSFVSKYENGEQRLDLFEIEEICKASGITLRAFVKRYLESRPPFSETD